MTAESTPEPHGGGPLATGPFAFLNGLHTLRGRPGVVDSRPGFHVDLVRPGDLVACRCARPGAEGASHDVASRIPQ